MTIFQKRLLRQWQAYKALYNQLFDGTILFYTSVFIIAASYYFIREVIVEGHFGLFQSIPVVGLVMLFLLYATMLRPQSMTEEADRLFWLHTPHYRMMKRAAMYYSLCIHIFYLLVAAAALAILLIPLHTWSLAMCAQLVMIGLAAHQLHAYSQLAFRPLIRRFIFVIAVVALSFGAAYMLFYTFLCSIVLFVALFMLYERHVIQSNRYFAALVTLQKKHQFRWQARLFIASKQLRDVQPQWHNKKRPRTFTQPYTKGASSALQELLLKSIWRNRTYRLSLVQMIGLSFLALVCLPIWANYVIAALLWLILLLFLEAVMHKLQQHAIFRVIPYSTKQWLTAYTSLKYRFASPFPLVYIIMTTLKWLI